MEFYSRYYPAPQIGLIFDEPSMTQQQFADECDINNILAKFVKTGFLDNIGPGVYADVSASGDYMEALDTIRRADEEFSALPSHIRKEFENNPANFLAFCSDPGNHDRAVEIGLIIPKKQTNTSLQNPEPSGANNPPPAKS